MAVCTRARALHHRASCAVPCEPACAVQATEDSKADVKSKAEALPENGVAPAAVSQSCMLSPGHRRVKMQALKHL